MDEEQALSPDRSANMINPRAALTQLSQRNGSQTMHPHNSLGSYHQDFYASKWFKTMQVLITMWVMAYILMVIIIGSNNGWYVLAPTLIVLICFMMVWALGGIIWSRVFKFPLQPDT